MTLLIDTIIRTLGSANEEADRLTREHIKYQKGSEDYLGVGLARMARRVTEAYNFLDELLEELKEPGTETYWAVRDVSEFSLYEGPPPRELIFTEHVVSQYLDLISVNGSVKAIRHVGGLDVIPYGSSYFNETACKEIKNILLKKYED